MDVEPGNFRCSRPNNFRDRLRKNIRVELPGLLDAEHSFRFAENRTARDRAAQASCHDYYWARQRAVRCSTDAPCCVVRSTALRCDSSLPKMDGVRFLARPSLFQTYGFPVATCPDEKLLAAISLDARSVQPMALRSIGDCYRPQIPCRPGSCHGLQPHQR